MPAHAGIHDLLTFLAFVIPADAGIFLLNVWRIRLATEMKEFDARHFWATGGDHYPPLTDDLIAQAEGILCVSLPSALIKLLKIQNGGRTRNFVYPMVQRTSWATDHIPLANLAGIAADRKVSSITNLLQTEYLTKEWGLPKKQVILSGDGPWWITLDYRGRSDPAVAWIDVDCAEDIQVAESFAAFLELLVPASKYD
jgi:hypothetical protein